VLIDHRKQEQTNFEIVFYHFGTMDYMSFTFKNRVQLKRWGVIRVVFFISSDEQLQ